MKLYVKISELSRYIKLRIPADKFERANAVEIPQELVDEWVRADQAIKDAQDHLYAYLDGRKIKVDVSGAG